MANHRLTDPDADLGAEPPPVYFKEWREANGFTQRQVERMHGWPKAKLSRLESGRTPWPPHVLAILARTYNCTIGDLISRLPPSTTAPSIIAAPAAETITTRVGPGFTGIVEMQQLIGRLKADMALLRTDVGPRLEQIERRIAEIGRVSDQAVRNAEELAEIFAHYAASLSRAAAAKKPEEL
jgi:transcriptional regulator with XRE-family HTH domain